MGYLQIFESVHVDIYEKTYILQNLLIICWKFSSFALLPFVFVAMFRIDDNNYEKLVVFGITTLIVK